MAPGFNPTTASTDILWQQVRKTRSKRRCLRVQQASVLVKLDECFILLRKSVGQWTQMQTFGWKNWSACVDGLMRPWEVSGLGKVHLSFWSIFPCFLQSSIVFIDVSMILSHNLAMVCHLHLWFSLISSCLWYFIRGVPYGKLTVRRECRSCSVDFFELWIRWLFQIMKTTILSHEKSTSKVGITPS